MCTFPPPLHQVAQYIKFEMPVLQSFITKLKEEEDREVQKLRRRYIHTTLKVIFSIFCHNFKKDAHVTIYLPYTLLGQ